MSSRTLVPLRSLQRVCLKRTMGRASRGLSSTAHQRDEAKSEPVKVDYSSLGGTSKTLPEWKPSTPISTTQTRDSNWKWGGGAKAPGDQSQHKHVEIDPFAPGRPMLHNYTLLVSGIVPRPIGFVSTLSSNGEANLAPFSYFQVVDHDPPVFVLGFSGRGDRPKDTLRNLQETGECVFNAVSEHMVEAVNATSVDAPYGVSEWTLSGLTKADSVTVRPSRVKEAIFSIEAKLSKIVEYDTSTPSVGPHGRMAILEGTRFWVREDAIDEKKSQIDLEKLRPVGQLGGVSYARIDNTFELPRTNWAAAIQNSPEMIDMVDKSKDSITPDTFSE